jgi:hypothetical protein
LSDQNLDAKGLAAASAAIKSGDGVRWDEDKIKEIAAGIASAPVPSKIGMYMLVVGFLLLLGMVGLMVVLVFRWLIGLVA